MPAGVKVKQKRKAGAFTTGQLDAGELGINTTSGGIVVSTTGTDISEFNKQLLPGVIVHGVDATTVRLTGFTIVIWIGSVAPNNKLLNDIWYNTA